MDDTKITDAVAQELSSTPYACTSLERLSGGTANFVYRGILSQPLNDGTKTVLIKHAEDYIATNKDFKLSAKRCWVEESALRALNSMHSVTTTNEGSGGQTYQVTVKTPQLYHFNPETNTQVMEDLAGAVDLKTFLRSPRASSHISEGWTRSIGRTVGIWLRSFHFWSADAAQKAVAVQFEKNQDGKKLKFSINYDSLLAMIDTYPDILEGSRPVFEKVRDFAAAELNEAGPTFGPIHGDSGQESTYLTSVSLRVCFSDQLSVLIPKGTLEQPLPVTPLFITDWELSQCGSRALDLGQMVAELYLLKHYKGLDDGLWAIEGFAEGYQDISEDIAFRALIHVGVHFIFFGSIVPDWGTQDQVRDVVRLGRDLITRAWAKDRASFKGEIWDCLFRS